MLLHFHVPTRGVGDPLLDSDLGHDDRHQDAPGRGRMTGVEVVTTGSDTSSHLQVSGSEERVSRPRVSGAELHGHFPGAALVTVIISL